MKTLLLLRHAKTKRSDSSQDDFDRPLKRSGIRAATNVGEFMRRKGIQPDLVVSSPAERAKRTAELTTESTGAQPALVFDPRIYNASVSTLCKVISEINKDVNVLLLVGHNPGIEDTLEKLTSARRHMKAGALAKVSFSVEEWDVVPESSGRFEFLTEPEELERESD